MVLTDAVLVFREVMQSILHYKECKGQYSLNWSQRSSWNKNAISLTEIEWNPAGFFTAIWLLRTHGVAKVTHHAVVRKYKNGQALLKKLTISWFSMWGTCNKIISYAQLTMVSFIERFRVYFPVVIVATLQMDRSGKNGESPCSLFLAVGVEFACSLSLYSTLHYVCSCIALIGEKQPCCHESNLSTVCCVRLNQTHLKLVLTTFGIVKG